MDLVSPHRMKDWSPYSRDGPLSSNFARPWKGPEKSRPRCKGGTKKGFDKKVRLWIEVQPGNRVYFDIPPRRMHQSRSVPAVLPTKYGVSSEDTITEESQKLLSRTNGPYTVYFATNNAVNIKQR